MRRLCYGAAPIRFRAESRQWSASLQANGPAPALNVFLIESKKKPLTILFASPRGFCAGVDRAILIVERAIERYGRPVYVRHEIMHDHSVVASLQAKGAIFVEEPDDVPDDRSVVLTDAGRLGITTGASAPDLLVDELVAAGRQRFDVAGEEVRRTEDKVVFKLPRALVA